MVKEIKWTKTALANLDNVVAYLNDNWPDIVTAAFLSKLNETLTLIATFPESGVEQKPNIHGILITKHNKLFYRVSDKRITVLRIFDTR